MRGHALLSSVAPLSPWRMKSGLGGAKKKRCLGTVLGYDVVVTIVPESARRSRARTACNAVTNVAGRARKGRDPRQCQAAVGGVRAAY